MPRTNLCNRLVVTSTLRILHLSSDRLSPLRPPARLLPFPRYPRTGFQTASSPEAPTTPQAVSSTSSGGAIGAARTSYGVDHPCTPGGGAPHWGVLTYPLALSASGRPNGLATDAFCRASRFVPALADPAERSQGPFPQVAHQGCRFPDPKRLPPMSPIHPTPCGARLVGPPLVPRFSRLGPASDTRSPTRVS